MKEIKKVYDTLNKEVVSSIAKDIVPLEKGYPVWGSTVSEEEKQRVSALAQKLSIDHK